MSRLLRFGVLAVLIGGALLLGAVPAHAGSGVELLVARKTSGPFKEEIRRNVPLGAKRDVYIKAKNVEMGDQTVNLFSPKELGAYRMKYFRSNGANVTTDVASGGGLQFQLEEGKAKTFRVQIRAKEGTTIGCLEPNVIFTGGGDDAALVAINTDIMTCGLLAERA